jgi:NNP family nitrate/nitrite transporter-like MFS transporter
VLVCLLVWQRRWVGTWVGPRGKVLTPASPASDNARGLDPITA